MGIQWESSCRAGWLENYSRNPDRIWGLGDDNKNKENYTDLISIQEAELIWFCGYYSDFKKSQGPDAKGHPWKEPALFVLQPALPAHPSAL